MVEPLRASPQKAFPGASFAAGAIVPGGGGPGAGGRDAADDMSSMPRGSVARLINAFGGIGGLGPPASPPGAGSKTHYNVLVGSPPAGGAEPLKAGAGPWQSWDAAGEGGAASGGAGGSGSGSRGGEASAAPSAEDGRTNGEPLVRASFESQGGRSDVTTSSRSASYRGSFDVRGGGLDSRRESVDERLTQDMDATMEQLEQTLARLENAEVSLQHAMRQTASDLDAVPGGAGAGGRVWYGQEGVLGSEMAGLLRTTSLDELRRSAPGPSTSASAAAASTPAEPQTPKASPASMQTPDNVLDVGRVEAEGGGGSVASSSPQTPAQPNFDTAASPASSSSPPAARGAAAATATPNNTPSKAGGHAAAGKKPVTSAEDAKRMAASIQKLLAESTRYSGDIQGMERDLMLQRGGWGRRAMNWLAMGVGAAGVLGLSALAKQRQRGSRRYTRNIYTYEPSQYHADVMCNVYGVGCKDEEDVGEDGEEGGDMGYYSE